MHTRALFVPRYPLVLLLDIWFSYRYGYWQTAVDICNGHVSLQAHCPPLLPSITRIGKERLTGRSVREKAEETPRVNTIHRPNKNQRENPASAGNTHPRLSLCVSPRGSPRNSRWTAQLGRSRAWLGCTSRSPIWEAADWVRRFSPSGSGIGPGWRLSGLQKTIGRQLLHASRRRRGTPKNARRPWQG